MKTSELCMGEKQTILPLRKEGECVLSKQTDWNSQRITEMRHKRSGTKINC